MKKKYKKLSIIIILLMIIVSNDKGRLNTTTQIIKEMTEGEYENQITELQKSHEEYADYIQTSKTNLAQAITNQGIQTASTDTFETMISNIGNIFTVRTKIDETIAATADNISEGKQAYVNGKLITGNGNANKNGDFIRLCLNRTMVTSTTYKMVIELYVEDNLIASYEDPSAVSIYGNYSDKELVNVNYKDKQYIISVAYSAHTGYGNYTVTFKAGSDTFTFNFDGGEYRSKNHLGIIYYSAFGTLDYTVS